MMFNTSERTLYTILPPDQLKKVDTYNPLLVSSRLHEVFAATGTRRGGQLTKVGAKRKTTAHPDIGTNRGEGGGGVLGNRSLGPKKTRVARGGFVYGGRSLT